MLAVPTEILFATSTIADGNMSYSFGGDTEVTENRKRFCQQHDLDYRQTVAMACDHGEKIIPIDWNSEDEWFGASKQADLVQAEVLTTKTSGVTLMLLTADCLPTAFYDPVTKTIALAHFSRETIAAGLPQKTVGFLRCEHHVDPTNLQIFVGPHIHQQSYAFPLPLATVSDRIAPFISHVNNHAYIDLAAAHNSQLTETGVQEKNIQLSEVDTFSSPNHFSHFASTRNNQKPQGRIATLLTLTK